MPKNYRKLTLLMSEGLDRRLRELAEREETSICAVARRLLIRGLEQEETK